MRYLCLLIFLVNLLTSPVTASKKRVLEDNTDDDDFNEKGKGKKGGNKTLKLRTASVMSNAPTNPSILFSHLDSNVSDKKNFIHYFKEIGASNIPANVGSELLLASIKKEKEYFSKYMISQGIKLSINEDFEYMVEIMDVIWTAITEKKAGFIASLIDFDPNSIIKLLNFKHFAKFPIDLQEAVKLILNDPVTIIDPESIHYFAELAAENQFVDLFHIIFESNLLTRMIPIKKLIYLYSDSKGTFDSFGFSPVFLNVINDRRITPPFFVNILIQAAMDDSVGFVDSIKPNLKMFSWDIIIKALDICLKKHHYQFADILLSTSSYIKPNYVYRLCSRESFIDSIAKHANELLLVKLLSMKYYGDKTSLLSDDCVRKICVAACYAGNIEVIETLISNKIVNFDMKFKGKSIFRMALESGQVLLTKYLIKEHGFNLVKLSDTPHYNPNGDSLIYIANNSNIDIFKYLLKLDADPNASVLFPDKNRTTLLYWCIKNGQELLVKALLEAGCNIDFSEARSFNTNPSSQDLIEAFLQEHESKTN